MPITDDYGSYQVWLLNLRGKTLEHVIKSDAYPDVAILNSLIAMAKFYGATDKEVIKHFGISRAKYNSIKAASKAPKIPVRTQNYGGA